MGKGLFETPPWSPSERVYDGSVIWCVSVDSICVIGVPVALWEIQLQFIRENFSCKFMTKKKDNFFWTIYGYSILHTLEKIDQEESLEI